MLYISTDYVFSGRKTDTQKKTFRIGKFYAMTNMREKVRLRLGDHGLSFGLQIHMDHGRAVKKILYIKS